MLLVKIKIYILVRTKISKLLPSDTFLGFRYINNAFTDRPARTPLGRVTAGREETKDSGEERRERARV